MKIILEKISKVIKSHIILQNVNMELESGNIYGFVGINGSGKTMLMRILTGLVSYTDGQLFVDGKPVDRNRELYYHMGVIIEQPEFFNDMTGKENLEMLASLKNRIGEEEIIQAMNRVDLDPFYSKKVKEYSLGMKQRLGIAQAIMENPDVYILDEVTNGLDDEGVQMLHSILREEKKKGKLIIISSHNKQDINVLCDYVYLFKNQTVMLYEE